MVYSSPLFLFIRGIILFGLIINPVTNPFSASDFVKTSSFEKYIKSCPSIAGSCTKLIFFKLIASLTVNSTCFNFFAIFLYIMFVILQKTCLVKLLIYYVGHLYHPVIHKPLL